MKPNDLVLRCFAERTDGVWSAVCLDLNLAAQSESLDAVMEKLDDQIRSYLEDAFTVDKEYAADLLKRRAPVSLWLRYYWIKLIHWLGGFRDGMSTIFNKVLPFQPCH